jgi:hypothetical protein
LALSAKADNISGQITDFAFGKNTFEGVFARAALSSVASVAADVYENEASFNANHLGGRFLYEAVGGLGALGGNALAQEVISGLGIRGSAATAVAQLGAGIGSMLAQNAGNDNVRAECDAA